MKVIEVICEALRLAGKADVADDIEGGVQSDEASRLKRSYLTYLNAVRDELARGYFPVYFTEELSSTDGKYPIANLSRLPVRINRVAIGEKAVEWHICPNYLVAPVGKITVKYEYAPEKLEEDDEFSYPDFAVGERLVEYGVVAEHFLVLGDAGSAAAWESKYRAEIENLLSRSTVRDKIPPRRWI